MTPKASEKRMKMVRNCWPIFFCIAGIILLVIIGSKFVNANFDEQVALNERVQIESRGYLKNTVYLESSEELSISRFDWIAFSFEGVLQKFQVVSFAIDGKLIELKLHENIPAGGKIAKIEYFVDFGKKEKFNKEKPKIQFLPMQQKNTTDLVIETSNKKHKNIPTAEIEQRICEVFQEDCETAIAVAKAESALNPKAIGDRDILINGSIGIFQINKDVHDYPMSDLLDAYKNIEIARKVFDDRKKLKGNGWLAWSAYTNGSYRQHL